MLNLFVADAESFWVCLWTFFGGMSPVGIIIALPGLVRIGDFHAIVVSVNALPWRDTKSLA
jgi:hypothetical protein